MQLSKFVEQRFCTTASADKKLFNIVNGKTAQGHAHNVENLPILYRVTGTAFTPVSSALDQLKKRRKLMFLCKVFLAFGLIS